LSGSGSVFWGVERDRHRQGDQGSVDEVDRQSQAGRRGVLSGILANRAQPDDPVRLLARRLPAEIC
jgi:hypothetical protein